MNAEQIAALVAAVEKLADAQARIARVLEDEAKIGGAVWAISQLPKVLDGIATEIAGPDRSRVRVPSSTGSGR